MKKRDGVQVFLDEVTKEEGKRVSVNRAQVEEIAKIINNRLHGLLYIMIRVFSKWK